MKKILVLLIVLFSSLNLSKIQAQGLAVELYTVCRVEADSLYIDLYTNNFFQISSFQFSVDYDDVKLEYKAFDPTNQLPGFDQSQIAVSNGAVRCIWIDPLAVNRNLPQYHRLATFQFTILAPDYGDPVVSSDPLTIEFSSNAIEVATAIFPCGFLGLGEVSGTIQEFENDCNTFIGDLESRWVVRFEENGGNVLFAHSTSDGHYTRRLPEGEYAMTLLHNDAIWTACDPTYSFIIDDQNLSIQQDIPLYSIKDCPSMEVELTHNILRRCFNSSYTINWANKGTITALNAKIEVLLDPYMSYVSSTVPATEISPNLYEFDLGDVASLEYGSIGLTVYLDCDSTVLGQTHCVEAEIFPNYPCEDVDPTWSGASIEATAECIGDSIVLSLHNVGTAPMAIDREFIVVEDDISFMRGKYNLGLGETKAYSFLAEGQTWRIVAEQEQGHPGDSRPTAALEGCTMIPGDFTTGFITQFRENDYDLSISIDCDENIGSYDPNDKQANPRGLGPDNEIDAEDILSYTIRFQNTGTDTAFNVKITDRISEHLDLNSLIIKSASHDYELLYEDDRVLTFIFPNINLPDSNVNQLLSNGYVKYEIGVHEHTPLGTEVTNNAQIYFDFNEAVVTNTTRHRIEEIVVTSVLPTTGVEDSGIQCFPIPTTGEINLLNTSDRKGRFDFKVFDTWGRLIETGSFEHFEQHVLSIDHLPAGLYRIRISHNGQLVEHLSIVLVRG